MRDSSRRALVEALALALLAALFVGGAAALLSLRNYPLYEARVQLRLLADPVIGDEVVEGGNNGEAGSFIATELITLSSPDLREQVSADIGSPVDLSAVQVGTANVVEVTVESDQRDVVAAADAVVTRYVGGRRANLVARISSVDGEVDRQLQAASAEITRLSEDDSITAQVQRAALTNEYTRLLEQSNTLQLATDASQRLVQVVNNAQSAGARQVVSPARDGALGAVVGAVLGAGLALGLSRLRHRVTSLDDLLELSPETALPTLPHLRGRPLATKAGRAASSYVSALTRSDQGFGRPPIVVIAPTQGCGATFVAVGLAVASARRQPTILLAAGDALDGAAASMLGVDDPWRRPGQPEVGLLTNQQGLTYVAATSGSTEDALDELERCISAGLLGDVAQAGVAVVVDAPALDSGGAGLELARRSGQVLLVGGVDRSTSAELEAAARSLRRVGAHLTGVVLSTPYGDLLPWRRRR